MSLGFTSTEPATPLRHSVLELVTFNAVLFQDYARAGFSFSSTETLPEYMELKLQREDLRNTPSMSSAIHPDGTILPNFIERRFAELSRELYRFHALWERTRPGYIPPQEEDEIG